MPRLHPRMLHHARKIDPLLPLVLQGIRELNSAKNELRWLKEFITSQPLSNHANSKDYDRRLRKVCVDRARGKPLQYIMGSEYFGDLEIACQPGVLIPRQETATSVTHLISRLHQVKTPLPKYLKVLDLCTGTGCIPLLSYYEFTHKHHRKAQDLEVVGVDISPTAISLANKNLQRLISDETLHPKPNLQFLQADILAAKDNEGGTGPSSLYSALQHYTSATSQKGHHWDILISNPPYISPTAFAHTTTRSVKRYEPVLSLVPSLPTSSSSTPQDTDQATQDQIQGDLFYPRLLSIAADLSVKVVLFEVADLEQAKRVAGMAEKQGIWDGVEIWRDDPSSGEVEMEAGIKVMGTGNGRSIVAYRGEGKDWLYAGS